MSVPGIILTHFADIKVYIQMCPSGFSSVSAESGTGYLPFNISSLIPVRFSAESCREVVSRNSFSPYMSILITWPGARRLNRSFLAPDVAEDQELAPQT
jgi:hypothetical protein